MKKLVFAFFFLLIAGAVYGQDKDSIPDTEVDSLDQFTFQYKGERFPYDSGVAISYPQYDFIFRKKQASQIIEKHKNADKPVEIIYLPAAEEKHVRPWVWTVVGVIIGIVGTISIK